MTTGAPAHSRKLCDCIVIGSGIAGVCAALYIQRCGASVAIVDPDPPGSGASGGNAGIVVNTKLLPVFAGLTASTLFAMLRSPTSPLEVRWTKFLGLTPWFLRMLSHAGPGEVERIARALANLCRPAARNYSVLWKEAGMGDLVRARGSLALYHGEEDRDRDWESHGYALLRSIGVPMERGGPSDIKRLAPTVSPAFTHGIYSPDFQHSIDLPAFVGRLVDLFLSKGGTHVAERVEAVSIANGKVCGVKTASRTIPTGSVVVAANTESARLATLAGERVPHQAVGGYHVMLEAPGIELETPVLPMDFRIAMTPMRRGIRVAGIYEFGGESKPLKVSLITNMMAQAGNVLPGIDVAKRTEWRGFRSYLPDALPIISKSSRHERLFYLFGLASMGMINGVTAGRVLAQLWDGQEPDFDMTPYRIGRF